MIHGCDTVTVAEIPSMFNTSHDAILGYIDGRFANERQVVTHDPLAHHLTVAVNPRDIADILDIERMDAEPSQAPNWWHDATLAGIWRPCFYAPLSLMDEVRGFVTRAGIHRTSYRLLVAHYDGIAEVPQGYDGKQYTDRLFGRNLDGDVFLDTFFRSPASYHHPKQRLMHGVNVQYDEGTQLFELGPQKHVKIG